MGFSTCKITFNSNWKRILKIFLPFILTVGLFEYIGSLAAGFDIIHESPIHQISIFQSFILSIFEFFGTFLIIWLFRKYLDKESILTLGFQKIGHKPIFMGIIIGFIIIFSGFSLLLLCNQIKVISVHHNIYDLLLGVGLFTTIAFTEESLVRGYILNNLMSSMNKYASLIISSVIFSLLHLFNPNINLLALTNLFLAGILLGISYIYTKNLWFPISLHFSWNFFQGAVFGFNVSGMGFHSVIIQKLPHPNIWNGGLFGFEGSVFCIILQIITIVILYFYLASTRNVLLSNWFKFARLLT